MKDKKVAYEDSGKYSEMGGRQLTSQFVSDEVDATCNPLGPFNKLIFAPGIVSGTTAPNSGRISVGAKSPLTGGIKESNSGGTISNKIARLGIKAIVVEGIPDDGLYTLVINKDGAKLESANDLQGKVTSATFADLFKKYGEKVSVAGIGPSGEMKMASAGICVSDPENRASRYAGRGGLGAVMGSKGLKAIVVDDAGGPGVEIKDKELFKSGTKALVEAIRAHDVTKPGGGLNSFGTPVTVNPVNEAGGLPTRNFQTGYFPGGSKIGGEAIAEVIAKRGGKGMVGHRGCSNCIIQCSNVYPREDGSEHVSCLEYESVWSLGANLEIDDLDVIAELILQCNEIGIDTMEAGATIGVAMEAGVVPFGDGQGAIKLMKEIREGTPLGRILGGGALLTGKTYGVTRIPTAKGQAMAAYEPRAIKGIGVTYFTSPMGGDHTAGYTVSPEIFGVGGTVDPLSNEGKVELSSAFQAATAFVDSTGYCLFITFATADNADGNQGMIDTWNAVVGSKLKADDVLTFGRKVLNVERAFNKRAGFTSVDDMAPEFMRIEKLPPHNQVFDISDEAMSKIEQVYTI